MEISEDRRQKLQRFRDAGRDPYPVGSTLEGRAAIADVLQRPGPDADPRGAVSVAGRIMAARDHGNSLFVDLKDASGRVQAYLHKKALGPEVFDLFKHGLDLGDVLAVRGELGRTKKGEATVFAEEAELLAKAHLAPPSEHFGLQDVEQRYRQRHVDLTVNPETAERFRRRGEIVGALRAFLVERGFLEVETPMLHAIAGGAAAKPFVTHHNALDADLYLRIAPELYLKRLIVGGYERVFEIGRNFRNEGLSPRHNPEFTMLEAYWAYGRAHDWMDACEEMLVGLGLGTAPYARRPYAELLSEHAGVDVFDAEAVAAAAKARGLEVDGAPPAKVADDLFGATVEEHLDAPTYVTDFPIELSPLAKASPGDARVAERFELYVAGMEIANGFSELNDPDEQLRRFEAQVASRDPELPAEVDHDYVEALRFGMPPATGIGIGVDRLVMLLTGADSIRDVIPFPLLRPLDRD